MGETQDGSIPFQNFVNWLLENDENSAADFNWAPISSQCDLCKIQYDFIGHLETYEEDLKSLADNLSTGTVLYIQ